MTDATGGPGPSIWPVTLALGVSIAAAGAVTHWLVAAAGIAIAGSALAGWAADIVRGDA